MHTLTGQLIAVMLLALALSYGIALVISQNERERALFQIRRDDCVARTAAIASLIRHTHESLHGDILRSVNSPFNRYWISTAPASDVVRWQADARAHLLEVRAGAGQAGANRSTGAQPATRPSLFVADQLPDERGDWEAIAPSQRGVVFNGQFVPLPSWNGMGVILNVRDDLFVNAVTAKPRELEQGNTALYASFGLSALLLSLASVLVARRVGRPLRRLANVADRVGRGETVEPLPEEGAEDIQSTAAAINRMQARLRRFVEDRTNMIAAISHDLRTPITSLRLRAEFIAEPEMREKIIGTLNELQAMVDATLNFAREESVVEPTRPVDLDSLVQSLCEDLADMGWDISFEAGRRIACRCRPEGIKRALRNVIENAVRYGARAKVRLEEHRESIDIIVDDEGPGIPAEDHERVFTPFVRLETSRSRDTGGVGLGLSIARTIVHAHGGEMRLANLPARGLRVTLHLPTTTDNVV